jgi:hypothetical protein
MKRLYLTSALTFFSTVDTIDHSLGNAVLTVWQNKCCSATYYCADRQTDS